jgi:CRP/FNR family transcriptional regulator
MSQGAASPSCTPVSQPIPSAFPSAVSAAEREQLLAAAAAVRDYVSGDLISRPHSHPEHAFLLERGYVRLYRLSANGAEATLRLAGPGEFFGSLPLLGVKEDRCFAVALCSSTVARISGVALERLLRTRPQLVLALSRQVADRLRRIEDRMESLAVCGARNRVAECLLGLAEEFGRPAGKSVILDLPLTQEAFASLVGMVRQTLNASLRSLRAEGLIATRRGAILLDPSGLRNLTGAGRENAPAPAA